MVESHDARKVKILSSSHIRIRPIQSYQRSTPGDEDRPPCRRTRRGLPGERLEDHHDACAFVRYGPIFMLIIGIRRNVGLVELVSRGEQDRHLIERPEISFGDKIIGDTLTSV